MERDAFSGGETAPLVVSRESIAVALDNVNILLAAHAPNVLKIPMCLGEGESANDDGAHTYGVLAHKSLEREIRRVDNINRCCSHRARYIHPPPTVVLLRFLLFSVERTRCNAE